MSFLDYFLDEDAQIAAVTYDGINWHVADSAEPAEIYRLEALKGMVAA